MKAQGPADPSHSADFIVIGAGSAGCTLASRLTESGAHSVLLLEAGGSDRRLWVHVPLGVGKLLNDAAFVWKANTEPERELHGNKLYWPSGRILGGSSSVNGMVAVRGHPARYDEWRDAGCPGWGANDVLPYFMRLESCALGDPALRGRSGPIRITELPGDRISNAFVDACGQAGYPRVADYNGSNPDGAAPLQLTARNGRRCSAAVAYLDPAKQRANLDVVTHATATRIEFDGKRAVGVHYSVGGEPRYGAARREVLVAAGAIRSPQLLELSGIGNPDVLQRNGIAVHHPLARRRKPAGPPDAAHHVRDEPADHGQRHARQSGRAGALAAALSGRARRPVRDDVADGARLRRGRPDHKYPDIRVQSALVSAESRFSTSRKTGIDPFPGFHIGGYFLYPESRGSLHVTSRDPNVQPAIRANYLSSPLDRAMIVAVLKIIRNIAAQPALAKLIVRETRPTAAVTTDDELLDYARRTGQTCWHPVGTCRMGTDSGAVVDPELRVRGLEGLRVIDASVMPFLTASNTNLPTIMVAEKGADLVLKHAGAR